MLEITTPLASLMRTTALESTASIQVGGHASEFKAPTYSHQTSVGASTTVEPHDSPLWRVFKS